jgi:hypothetical protein
VYLLGRGDAESGDAVDDAGIQADVAIAGVHCTVGELCEVVVNAAGFAAAAGGAAMPLLHATIAGPTTLVPAASIATAPAVPAVRGVQRLVAHITFVPAESGAHRIALREEYTSESAALRDFAAASAAAAPPSFVGEPLHPAQFALSVAPRRARLPPLPECRSVGDATRDGYWQRSPDDAAADAAWRCPEFYLPQLLLNAFAGRGMALTKAEAYAPHNDGVPMWRPREHVRRIVRAPSVRTRWADAIATARLGSSVRLEATLLDDMRATVARRAEATRRAGGEWRWVPRACVPGPLEPREAARRVRAAGGLVVLGDSVSRFTFNFARCALTRPPPAAGGGGGAGFGDAEVEGGVGVVFEGPDTDAARGAPASGESMRYVSVRAVGSLADAHAVAAAGAAGSALDAARAAAQFARPGGATVVANCGLWDVAYGDDDLGSYGTRLGEVRSSFVCLLIFFFVSSHLLFCLPLFFCLRLGEMLALLRRALGEHRLVWASTSAVHPVHYMRVSGGGDLRKRAMTDPRVERANGFGARAALAVRAPVIDMWQLTRLREDDPLTPSDMRHFGPSTVGEMAQLVVRAAAAVATQRTIG